ncbi:MAG: hypothetical protein FJX74_03980, partial [Armatimonadetes bacterium]|nr:hypothetical protein [Armatimonadota bacterium]
MADTSPATPDADSQAGALKRSAVQRVRDWLGKRPPGLTVGAAACLIVAALAIGALIAGPRPRQREGRAPAGPEVLWYRSEPGGNVRQDVSDASENLSDDRVVTTARPIQHLRATIELSVPSAATPETDPEGTGAETPSPAKCVLMRVTPWPPPAARGNVTFALLAIYYAPEADKLDRWVLKLTQWEDGAQTTNVKQSIELPATAGTVTVKATAGDSLNIAAADGVIDERISGERFEVSFGGDVAASKIGATVMISEPLPKAPDPAPPGDRSGGQAKHVIRQALWALLAFGLLLGLAVWCASTSAAVEDGRRAWQHLEAAAREAGTLDQWQGRPRIRQADQVGPGLLAKIRDLKQTGRPPPSGPKEPPSPPDLSLLSQKAGELEATITRLRGQVSDFEGEATRKLGTSDRLPTTGVLGRLAELEKLVESATARLRRPALAPVSRSGSGVPTRLDDKSSRQNWLQKVRSILTTADGIAWSLDWTRQQSVRELLSYQRTQAEGLIGAWDRIDDDNWSESVVTGHFDSLHRYGVLASETSPALMPDVGQVLRNLEDLEEPAQQTMANRLAEALQEGDRALREAREGMRARLGDARLIEVPAGTPLREAQEYAQVGQMLWADPPDPGKAETVTETIRPGLSKRGRTLRKALVAAYGRWTPPSRPTTTGSGLGDANPPGESQGEPQDVESQAMQTGADQRETSPPPAPTP